MELWVGAVNLGFLYAIMTMGVFITFRIHDFPDITVDGSFTAGAAAAAVLMTAGVNPFLALCAAFLLGSAAGWTTAFIHTRFRVNGLLAGILIMTALYSINLHIMGRSNIPLLNQKTLFSMLSGINPGLHPEVWTALALTVVMAVFWLVMSFFFKTDLGIAMRVTGNNPAMAAANGINVSRMTMFGVALANGFVGTSGALVAQYQGFADIGMGIGTVVIGLAAVIIGESILKKSAMWVRVLSVIIGAIVFRLMIAIALYVGMNPIDLKLLTAVFVFLTLVFSKSIGKGESRRPGLGVKKIFTGKTIRWSLTILATLALLIFGYRYFTVRPGAQKHVAIGCVQLTENGLLNMTRDSFVEELKRLGYRDGENCSILLENAGGELPTVNTILDKFTRENVDVIVTISTGCTQVAINKIKDKPIVFATVANPFIIKAGSSDSVHLPNVTGVYGWVPMDKTLSMVKKILPGPLTIGAIWDPAQANSVFNVEFLQKETQKYSDVAFKGATITNSADVYEAAVSLVQKGITAFVLSPDNIVYSAFESVVKAAQHRKIPIFMSDVERLQDGALGVLGYDYSSSGEQAAVLVDRILKGEKPADIPFENYKKLTVGINLDVAKQLGIAIPDEVRLQANKIISQGRDAAQTKAKIGIVQFALEPNVEICKQGILKALAENGFKDGENLEIIYKNAQADFSMIPAIMQDLVRRNVDVIIPLSTPCVQAAVQVAGAQPDAKIVFTYIFDPYRIGAAKTPENHLPNMTGVACFPPVEGMLDLIKEMLPGRKKIGVVWNSSEANSESVLIKLRAHAVKTGQEIIEATVTNPAEVLEAARSLILKGSQVFLNAGDNTVNVGFDSFSKAGRESKIPVFSVDSEFIDKGALAILGPDYYQTGYEGGQCLARVLKGENAADIPITQTKATQFMINTDAAQDCGITVSKSVLQKAQRIVNGANPLQSNSATPTKKLALFLFSDHNLIIETARGVKDELASSGALTKYGVRIDTKNAQNEFYLAQSIAQDIVAQKYDYMVTLTTPTLMAAANMNKHIPHIFGAVTDPYRAGVAKTPTDHLPHITGVATVEPVDATMRYMRELFPAAKKIGLVWNPGEACSETCTYIARESAKKFGFDLLEANVSATSEVMDALKSLLNKKIDLFLTSGDNTVIMSMEATAGVLRQNKIPYFTNAASDVERGAFTSVGPDYYVVGKKIAQTAIRVMAGEKPKDIPIESFAPDVIYLNLDLAREYGLDIPAALINKAAKVIHHGKLVTPAEFFSSGNSAGAAKRVALFLFSDNPLLTEVSKGVMEELERNDFIKKQNLVIDHKNAQNEFYMAQSIAQDIVRQNYDYVITASTPALQVMANSNKKIPHIFGGVTDPYRMGVAKTSADHQANITGVATFQPVASTLKLMREIFPQAKTIGLIWNPAEACSEACTFKAREAAKKSGFDLLETTISSTGEVSDALKSIINKKPDLFLTSGDNTVILAMASIAKTLRQHKIPYFTNSPVDVDRGAFLGLGADYIEVGRATGKLAVRVISGENPQAVPIYDFVPEKMNINLALAREYGLSIPASVRARAARVVE